MFIGVFSLFMSMVVFYNRWNLDDGRTRWTSIQRYINMISFRCLKFQFSDVLFTCQATVEKIYNVLLFPDGGWMVDQRTVCLTRLVLNSCLRFSSTS